MSDHYVPKLGEIIAPDDREARRDCVHIAVAPLLAGEDLVPGQDFQMTDGLAWPADLGRGVGIVDPFLENVLVKKGERFWGCLYPGTITGLRHQWVHPAFAPKPPIAMRRMDE